MRVERALTVENMLGEGLTWSVREQTLYWVDLEGEAFFRWAPPGGACERFEVGTRVTALAPRRDGGVLLATARGLALWNGPGEEMTILADPLGGCRGVRFNDGAADGAGRFWVGTMPTDEEWGWHQRVGVLYRLSADASMAEMDHGFAECNGLGWSPDGRTMYLVDTPDQVIWAYDFDPPTGAVANRRPFARTDEEPGMPDGLRVDAEGGVWSARWGGSRLIRYDAHGRKEREMILPVEYPTACAFGGPRLDDLYITTAQNRLTPAERARQPYAGDLLRARLSIFGLPQGVFAG